MFKHTRTTNFTFVFANITQWLGQRSLQDTNPIVPVRPSRSLPGMVMGRFSWEHGCVLFWDVQIWLQIYTRHHESLDCIIHLLPICLLCIIKYLRYLSFPTCFVSLSNDWSRAVLATNSFRGGSHFSVPKSCFLICQTQDSLSHNIRKHIRKHTATFYSSSQALKHLFVSGHSPATRMHTSPQRTITTGGFLCAGIGPRSPGCFPWVDSPPG